MNRFAFRRPRSGVTTVEFAFTIPVLFLFVFAAFELGRANMMMHTAEAAAYEGARTGIIPGAQADECITAARQILGTCGIGQAGVEVTPENLDTISEDVAVEVSVSFKDNTILAPLFMGDSVIERTCRMTRER